MRPYLAILKDSFREAFASRMLWILIAIIAIVLFGLAGFRLEDSVPFRFERIDFLSPGQMVQHLRKTESLKPAERRVWDLLPEDSRAQMQDFDPDQRKDRGQRREQESALRDAFNGLLERTDLYDAAAFESTILGEEVRAELNAGIGDLQGDRLKRFNRLLIEAALPEYIRPVGNSALSFHWYWATMLENQPMTRLQLLSRVRGNWLVSLLSYFLGGAGVLAAILVTSSIIPRTFEPGEIDLLLSKPVARPLLFLTKFLGGCAYIFLLAAVFVVGLWLIVGWRLDLWMGRLLLCIPAFVFTFSIFYSVSVLVGVIWRNAIISVVCTMVFWVVCFTAKTTRDVMELFLNGERVEVITPVGTDELFAARKSGDLVRWNAARSVWNPVGEAVSGTSGKPDFGLAFPMQGPFYDPQSDRLIALRFEQRGFQAFRSSASLAVGTRENEFQLNNALPVPAADQKIALLPDGQILTYGSRGVHRFEGEVGQAARPFVIAGFDLARVTRQEGQGKFIESGPEEARWQEPFDASLDPETRVLTVFSAGRLVRVQPQADGRYAEDLDVDLETDQPALVAARAELVTVCLGDGQIILLAGSTLEEQARFEPYGANKPKDVQISADGRWVAVLFHHRRIWMYDAREQREFAVAASGQGDISSLLLDDPERIWIADRFGRVTRYELPSWNQLEQYSPEANTFEQVYRYAVSPLYTVFPKPGQLDDLIRYIITGEETKGIPGRELNLRQDRAVFDVREAVWSNVAFIVVMLSFTSFLIWRRDF